MDVEYPPQRTEPPVPARRTLLLALADAVEDGRHRSVAAVTRAVGLPSARLSQVMRRRMAGTQEQERILTASKEDLRP